MSALIRLGAETCLVRVRVRVRLRLRVIRVPERAPRRVR